MQLTPSHYCNALASAVGLFCYLYAETPYIEIAAAYLCCTAIYEQDALRPLWAERLMTSSKD